MIRNCCGTRVATFMRLAIVPSALLLVAATAPRTLHASRPTGELFAERFKTGSTTDRIDRIAAARAHDLRENRYTAWGVR